VRDSGGAAYLHEVGLQPEGGLGAVHGMEMPLLLGHRQARAGSPVLGRTDRATVEAMGGELRRRAR